MGWFKRNRKEEEYAEKMRSRVTEYYSKKVGCNNCRTANTVRIPMGTTIYEYLKWNIVICYNCGCSVMCRTGPVRK